MTRPVLLRWEGDGFTPANAYHAKRADQMFVVGELYAMAEHADRSGDSHRHYFASLKEGWLNLPQHLQERFPSPEHLRKWALIKAGFFDSRTLVLQSADDAKRVAAFMEPKDEFAVVTVDGATITEFTAKSQSYAAMGKRAFQESKDRVLDVVSDLIEISRAELERNAGKAA